MNVPGNIRSLERKVHGNFRSWERNFAVATFAPTSENTRELKVSDPKLVHAWSRVRVRLVNPNPNPNHNPN